MCVDTVNIGIGINVNEDLDDFPNSIKNNVTSLKLITQNNIQREPLMASILNELDSLIDNNNIICLLYTSDAADE